MTFRRLKVLVSQLRPGSRLSQEDMLDDAWTSSDYLMVAILDSLDHLSWLTANRGVTKSKRSKHPEPMDRPADVRAKRDHDRAQLKKARAFLAAIPQPGPPTTA